MNDRRLAELLLDYGRFIYGTAYMNLCAKGIVPTYELLKAEIDLISNEYSSAKQF